MNYNFFDELAKMVEKINYDNRALSLSQLVTCQLEYLLPSIVYTSGFYIKMGFPYDTISFDMYSGVFEKKAFFHEVFEQLKQRGLNGALYTEPYEELPTIHVIVTYRRK